MKKNLKSKSSIAVLGAMVVLVITEVMLAGVSVSPLQQWVNATPGAQGRFTLTIANIKRSPRAKSRTVIVTPVHFQTTLEGGLQFGSEYKHDRSAVNWIKFKQNEFVLEPNEVKIVEMQVEVPTSADGDYWAALMVSTKKAKKKNINFDFRAASGVFIRVGRRNYIERADITNIAVTMPDFVALADADMAVTASSVDTETNVESDNSKSSDDMSDGMSDDVPVFGIKAQLNNSGLIAFIANAKAVIYSTKWKTIATIPMFSNRRRVFPADSRTYSGVLSDPLPAGKYTVRVFVESETESARKIINDIPFNVTSQQAKQWAKFNKNESDNISIEPKEIKLELTGGRLTSAKFTISNDAMATISAAFSKSGTASQWLKFRSPQIAVGPKMQRTIISTLRVPKGTSSGEYTGIITVNIEKAGLANQAEDNKKQIQIPLVVTVAK